MVHGDHRHSRGTGAMNRSAPVWWCRWTSFSFLAVVQCISCGESGDEAVRAKTWAEDASAVTRGTEGNDPPEIAALSFASAVAVPGQDLRVLVDASDPNGDGLEINYVWSIDGRRFPSRGPSVTLPETLARNAEISVEVVVSDGIATSEAHSIRMRVANRAPRIEELGIRIVGDSDEDLGEWVADPVGYDPDDDEISFRFEWRVNDDEIVSEEERLPRGKWKRGDEIVLSAWPSDGDLEGDPMVAAPFRIGNSAPDIVSRPPGLDATGRFVYRVEARDRDGDRGLRYALVSGPEDMAIDPFSGEVVWRASAEDAGEHQVTIEVDDRHGGSTRQSFYVVVEAASARRDAVPAGVGPSTIDPNF